jgi:hypothetical protein
MLSDEFVGEEFEQNDASTKVLVKKRQDTRSMKEGQIALQGSIESFVTQVKENGIFRNMDTATPPPVKMSKKKDGSGAEFPTAIPCNVRLTDFVPVKDLVVPEGNSWKIKFNVGYIDKAEDFLKKHCKEAWAPEHVSSVNDKYARIRTFIDKDEKTITHLWQTINKNEVHKVKASGAKESVLRQKIPPTNTVFLVQPSTPCKFTNVVPEIWVSTQDVEIKEEDKRKETVLMSYTSFNCKGQVTIHEDYNPNLTRTERLHETENPYVHNLVPVIELQTKRVPPPRSAYFYVKERMQTPWNPACSPDMKGITVMRNTDTEITDYHSNKTNSAALNVRFNLYQWTGRPNTSERYIVKVIGVSDCWKNYGILDPEYYALIVGANVDLPIHIQATLWEKATITHDSNDPKTINNKPELVNIRGYYIFGGIVVPDFLRHFKTKGLRVSNDWVLSEFSYWESENKATKRRQINLKPLDETIANPVNANGLQDSVVALGNGYYPTDGSDASPECGKYHAFSGNIASLFEGQHDFYVLTSRVLSFDEKIKYAGGVYADELINQLRGPDKKGLFYWIYAVKKDARMAKSFGVTRPAVAVSAFVDSPSAGASKKRESPDAEGEDEEEQQQQQQMQYDEEDEEEEISRPTKK